MSRESRLMPRAGSDERIVELLSHRPCVQDAARWDPFADPARRQIVARLVERPQAGGELASLLPVSRSAVSQHLRVLKDAGLVSERADLPAASSQRGIGLQTLGGLRGSDRR